MIDIVVDTCVLVHANNAKSGYQKQSIAFIEKLLDNTTLITVDVGFSLDETTNSSYLGLEYITHITPGMLGYDLLQKIALSQRFNFVEQSDNVTFNRYVNRLIINRKDRHFTKVTYNSIEKTLVTHDFTDYQKAKRKKIKKDYSLIIVVASEINGNL